MTLQKYVKGAGAERQFRKLVELEGFVVIRSAKSGVDGTSPDLIALKKGDSFLVECKAHEKSLYFPTEKFNIMRGFEEKSGVKFYVAWKINRRGWRLFPLTFLNKTSKGYSLKLKDFEKGVEIENIIKLVE